MPLSIHNVLYRTIRKSSHSLLLLALILSCKENEKQVINGVNLSSQPISIASGFKIEKKDSCTVVTITNPWQGSNSVMVHYLVRKGSRPPHGVDSSEVIFVPLSRIICMSTTHVGMISALGEENSIKGVSGTGFIFDSSITRMVNHGLIEEVGYESNLNKELIISISPDLIMMYGIGSESAGHVSKIKELGIEIMFNADYLESDPLGKAEWIKLFGALYCKEVLADSIFREEVYAYDQIRKYITLSTTEKPIVLLGLPFKDTWYVSPGNSFISRLISDAGGKYLWHNTSSSYSIPYGIENVYIEALNADFWLNIGNVTKADEILLIDKRLGDLKCFKKRKLYNNNNHITPDGGNDYWESGTLMPHLILKDIASILHPGLFDDHQLLYYRKIE